MIKVCKDNNCSEIEKMVIIPKYGICAEIPDHYPTSTTLQLKTQALEDEEIYVFLTDPKQKSYCSLPINSDNGVILKGNSSMFDTLLLNHLNIEVHSRFLLKSLGLS